MSSYWMIFLQYFTLISKYLKTESIDSFVEWFYSFPTCIIEHNNKEYYIYIL